MTDTYTTATQNSSFFLADVIPPHPDSGPWADAEADVRFEILALVHVVIINTAMPGQPPNAFLIWRERFTLSGICNSRLMAAPPGAQPGSMAFMVH